MNYQHQWQVTYVRASYGSLWSATVTVLWNQTVKHQKTGPLLSTRFAGKKWKRIFLRLPKCRRKVLCWKSSGNECGTSYVLGSISSQCFPMVGMGWSSTTYSKGFNGPIVRIPPSRWDDCNAFDKVSTDGTHFRGIKVDAKIYGNFEGFLGWNIMTPVWTDTLVWLEMLWRPSSIMNIISTMNCMIRTIMIRVIIFQMFVKMLISIMCFSKWQLYMIMRNHARLSVFGICLC